MTSKIKLTSSESRLLGILKKRGHYSFHELTQTAKNLIDKGVIKRCDFGFGNYELTDLGNTLKQQRR